MAKKSSKKSLSLFSKKSRLTKRSTLQLPGIPYTTINGTLAQESTAAFSSQKSEKKKTSRLWMRFDRTGESEILECDKTAIIRRASIPARDLRILGPIFSDSSNILAREKAMVINLEFVKAIVTAEEVLLLDPLSKEVLPFVDQLRHQILLNNPFRIHHNERGEGETELPFEFQVLEVALEVVCTYLDSSVADLERDAYPALDELATNVSTKNLEHVRSLKSNLTRLLARVQKVRGEIEHLMDDNEDMAHLYLSRRQLQIQQAEPLLMASSPPILARVTSNSRVATSAYSDDNDVEDLEMLLEAYFMQLEGTRNKILSVREYIDDTEDYVNIQLDNQRNGLIQLQLVLTMAAFAVGIDTLIVGIFGMNIKCELYNWPDDGLFWPFVAATSSGCFFIFLLMLSHARWKKLLGP